MDHQGTIWIKKEETDVLPDQPGLVFLEDPLKTEVPGLPIKPNPELKWCMDSSESNFVSDPLGISWANNFIKEDPGLNLEADETVSIVPSESHMPERPHQVFIIEGNDAIKKYADSDVDQNKQEILTIAFPKFENAAISEVTEQFRSELQVDENALKTEEDNDVDQNKQEILSIAFPKIENDAVSKDSEQFISSELEVVKVHKLGAVADSLRSVRKRRKIKELPEDAIQFSTTSLLEENRVPMFHSHAVNKKHSDVRFDIHSETHSVETSYKCDHSGKSFNCMANMVIRSRLHTNELALTCDTRGKSYTKRSDMISYSRIHRNENSFRCDTCGKSFQTRDHMITHSRIHTNDKPFRCETCGKAFTCRSSIIHHIRIHTNDKPFKCETCGKSFTQRSAMVVHSKIHTNDWPFRCETCGKSFTKRAHLITHSRFHTNDRPFRKRQVENHLSREPTS